MLINVTQDHIDRGVKEDCEKCPVALAVFETVPGCVYADVSDIGIKVHIRDVANGGYGVSTTKAPASVPAFYAAFDSGRPVKPFSFELTI